MRLRSTVAVIVSGLALLALSGSALAGPVSVGHSGWSWGNPVPQGDGLKAVAFDGATGYAVGDFGTVLTSGDGGATWSGLPSGTFQDLTVVQELSPSVVIVGGGCSVRESVNGGSNFVDVPINASESSCSTNVAALSFLDQNNGYVELQDGSILFTNNAGQTVQAKTPAPVGSGQGSDLAFVSSTTGFAVSGGGGGGLIERTTDGANSWTQVGSSPNGLNAITFVSPTTAFAVGDSNTLLESTDGGSTWQPQPLAHPAGAGPFNLEHISCSSVTTCVISTADGKELLRTADGAQTATIVNPSSQVLKDVAFSVGNNVIGVGDDGATVLSTDAGQTFSSVVSSRLSFTWSQFGAGLVPGGASGDAYGTGAGGQIAVTTNAGASWSTLRVPTGSAIDDVAFPTASTGYALDDAGFLHKTTDGGVSWASLDTGVGNPAAVAAPGANTVLLLGAGTGGVSRSTDGGNNFHTVGGKVVISTNPKRTMKLSRIALNTSQTIPGAVLAWQSRLIESTNSGRTWQSIPLPLPGRSIGDVSFVTPTTGYVIQTGSRVFFTRNRGRKWNEIDSIGVGELDVISFSSVGNGYVETVGAGSLNGDFTNIDVLHTTNGGRSWQAQVIVGQGGDVVATPSADYFMSDMTFSDQPDFTGLFSTTNGGASPQKSSLSISIGPKQLTAAKLRKAGHKITVKGKLRPVTSVGEMVQISHRTAGSGSWSSVDVRVASNGNFSFTMHGVRKTTNVVALALGDGVNSGAGASARLTVKP